jgi:hypothetical protein
MTNPVVVTHPCKNGELEDNGASQAKNSESSLTQHSNSGSSSAVTGVAMEPSSESSVGDVVRGLSRREMLILRALLLRFAAPRAG